MPPFASLPQLCPPHPVMRLLPYLLSTVLAVATMPLPAPALERAALVIGNDAYTTKPLKNAVNDASAVRDMLVNQLGFPAEGVIYGKNLDRADLYEKLETFAKVADGAKIAVIYYAGHGMESLDGRQNFVLPVDANLAAVMESEAKLRAGGVNLEELIHQASEAAPHAAKIVLLDCCRERPSGRGISRAGGGLATYADDRIPADTLVLLAAAPNKLASDGAGHGPFTRAVLDILPRSGGSILESFFAVSDHVIKSTQKQQIPWMKFDGSGRIFRENNFHSSIAAPSPTPILPRVAPPGAEFTPPASAAKSAPFVNSLGMKFAPVANYSDGKKVLFSIWETRRQDYECYAENNVEADSSWKNATSDGVPVGHEKDHPVVMVSWEDAMRFCEWLTKEEVAAGRIGPNDQYRLPTDDEWDLAVGLNGRESGDDANGYPWGPDFPPPARTGNFADRMWVDQFGRTTQLEGYKDGYPTTAPVGSYGSNRFGLFDLGGNVAELIYDQRVTRGAAWDIANPSLLLSSHRVEAKPASRRDSRGFRCVLQVSQR